MKKKNKSVTFRPTDDNAEALSVFPDGVRSKLLNAAVRHFFSLPDEERQAALEKIMIEQARNLLTRIEALPAAVVDAVSPADLKAAKKAAEGERPARRKPASK